MGKVNIARMLCLLLVGLFAAAMFSSFGAVNAQDFEYIYIREDGSVQGTDSIQRDEDVYKFTGNISGSIKVEKPNITVDGAGYTLTGRGYNISDIGIYLLDYRVNNLTSRIENVTVKNLKIQNFESGIAGQNCKNNHFIGNQFSNCGTGVWLEGSSGDEILFNTFADNRMGIFLGYCNLGGIFVSQNNFTLSEAAKATFKSTPPIGSIC